MKPLFNLRHHTDNTTLIAEFGRAQLVRRLDGQYELRGGTAKDVTDAKEWISLFLHEAVLRHNTVSVVMRRVIFTS